MRYRTAAGAAAALFCLLNAAGAQAGYVKSLFGIGVGFRVEGVSASPWGEPPIALPLGTISVTASEPDISASSGATGDGLADASGALVPQGQVPALEIAGVLGTRVFSKGAAHADLSMSVTFAIANTTDAPVFVLLESFYSIGTAVEVDPASERAAYSWNVLGQIGATAEDGPSHWGEAQSRACAPGAPFENCNNLFDDNVFEVFLTLGPNESVAGELFTVASFDLRTVDEAPLLALGLPGLLAAGLLVARRRRGR